MKYIDYTLGNNKYDNVRIIQHSQQNAPNDVWFHLNEHSSAHLIFHNIYDKNMNRLRKDGTIYRMSSILKTHMKKKLCCHSNHIEIIYAFVKDIQLTMPIGTVQTQKDNIILI